MSHALLTPSYRCALPPQLLHLVARPPGPIQFTDFHVCLLCCLPQVLSTGNSAYLVGGLTPDPQTEAGTVLSSIVRYDMNTGLSEELPRMEVNGVELPR